MVSSDIFPSLLLLLFIASSFVNGHDDHDAWCRHYLLQSPKRRKNFGREKKTREMGNKERRRRVKVEERKKKKAGWQFWYVNVDGLFFSSFQLENVKKANDAIYSLYKLIRSLYLASTRAHYKEKKRTHRIENNNRKEEQKTQFRKICWRRYSTEFPLTLSFAYWYYMIMALFISKQINSSSNFSGSLAKSVLSFGLLTLGYTGSGLFLNSFAVENG